MCLKSARKVRKARKEWCVKCAKRIMCARWSCRFACIHHPFWFGQGDGADVEEAENEAWPLTFWPFRVASRRVPAAPKVCIAQSALSA